jgi:hypothetical protein
MLSSPAGSVMFQISSRIFLASILFSAVANLMPPSERG